MSGWYLVLAALGRVSLLCGLEAGWQDDRVAGTEYILRTVLQLLHLLCAEYSVHFRANVTPKRVYSVYRAHAPWYQSTSAAPHGVVIPALLDMLACWQLVFPLSPSFSVSCMYSVTVEV